VFCGQNVFQHCFFIRCGQSGIPTHSGNDKFPVRRLQRGGCDQLVAAATLRKIDRPSPLQRFRGLPALRRHRGSHFRCGHSARRTCRQQQPNPPVDPPFHAGNEHPHHSNCNPPSSWQRRKAPARQSILTNLPPFLPSARLRQAVGTIAALRFPHHQPPLTWRHLIFQ
jgi:hypothetical protein